MRHNMHARTEVLEHLLGVIACRLVLDHRRRPGRGEAGEQHRRLDLRGGDRRLVDDRYGIACPLQASAGNRPPSACSRVLRAGIFSSGSRMRRIGRVRRLASPSKITVIGQPATAPMDNRQPVPELPKSSGARGSAKPPTPTPMIRHASSPVRSTVAPSARMALAVDSASSPSSIPVIRVSPTVMAPRISDRSEIDLSPGTRMRPCREARRG